jgi:hypothetical protein
LSILWRVTACILLLICCKYLLITQVLQLTLHFTVRTTFLIFASQNAPLYFALTSVPTVRYGGSSPWNSTTSGQNDGNAHTYNELPNQNAYAWINKLESLNQKPSLEAERESRSHMCESVAITNTSSSDLPLLRSVVQILQVVLRFLRPLFRFIQSRLEQKLSQSPTEPKSILDYLIDFYPLNWDQLKSDS